MLHRAAKVYQIGCRHKDIYIYICLCSRWVVENVINVCSVCEAAAAAMAIRTNRDGRDGGDARTYINVVWLRARLDRVHSFILCVTLLVCVCAMAPQRQDDARGSAPNKM